MFSFKLIMYIHSPSMSLSVFIVYIHTLAQLELQGYLKSCEMLTRHIQNPAMWHYSTIFRYIQNLVQYLHMQKPGILRISEYSKLFHNCIPTHSQNPFIFTKIYKYPKLRHISNLTDIQNPLKDLRVFLQKYLKTIFLQSTSFQIIVESSCTMYGIILIQVLYLSRTLSITVNSDKFSHIHVLFICIQPYCGVFRTLCNSSILGTQTCSEFGILRT